MQSLLTFQNAPDFALGTDCIPRPTASRQTGNRTSSTARVTKRHSKSTNMNEVRTHLRGPCGAQPPVRVESIGIATEQIRIAMENPGVHTEDGLQHLINVSTGYTWKVCSLQVLKCLMLLTSGAKKRPSIVIPPAGTTLGKGPTAAEWKRYTSLICAVVTSIRSRLPS